MDESGGHQLPLEWHPGPYGYDPRTNTFLPLSYYGYGWGVDYSWNSPNQQQGPMHNMTPYSSSSGRPPRAAARRGRGRRRHRFSSSPRQHGGPGLLGPDPSRQRPSRLPPPRRRASDEPSSSQPPSQVQPPVPVPLPPENRDPTCPPPASLSPSSLAMTPPVSDPVKDSHGNVTINADAKMEGAQDDMIEGLGGSSTATPYNKKKMLPLDAPEPMKNSDVDARMACRDDGQGDVLGLNAYMAKKRLLSTKASSLAADADVEEEAKAAARKKTRLGWGQGLAKYENRCKKDVQTTHKLVAHDEATGEAAPSHGSSPPPGSKGHGDNNSFDDMAQMRISQVTTVPALFSNNSSRPLTGDLGDPGKNGGISSLTEKAVSHDEMPGSFSRIHSPSPADDPQNLMEDVGGVHDRGSICQVHGVSHKGSLPPAAEDNSDAIAMFEVGSSHGCDAPPDESSMKFTKVQDISQKVISECSDNIQSNPRTEKIMAKMVQKPKKILKMNVLSDQGNGSMDEHEHVTEKVLVGESNVALSPAGMRSSQAAYLNISETEAPVLENSNENNTSNEEVCITKSSSKVKENVPQSVLIANHGDEGNSVAGESYGQETLRIIFFPDEISAKQANDTMNGDHVRSGARTPELSSSWKEWNYAAKHHSWKPTEKKLANSNTDDGRMAPSNMKNPSSKDNPCNTSDPAAMLTRPAIVQHMKEFDEAMGKKESEKNDDNVKGKEGNNSVPCVASKCGSGIQLISELNSHKEMEKFDSIPSPEGNDLNADIENPTKDSSPCIATNASDVRDDGLIQRLRASEAMYRNTENNDAKVKSKEGNPVESVASKECNGIQLSCQVPSQKGKGIMPSAEVNDPNAPPMQILKGLPKTNHLPSISGCVALDIVHANSSYVAMDIDLNIPLGVTPQVDLGRSTAEAFMDPSSNATDSDATMEISPSRTTRTVTQTVEQQPASQPGSIMLFGRVIYQAPSTGTAHHIPNEGNQIVVSSSNVPSNPVVPVIRRRGHGQVYPSLATTTTSVLRNSVPSNQQGKHVMLSNRMLYGGPTNAASTSAASPLQPGIGSSALVNMMNQQRQQALANMMRGRVPLVSSPNLMQGSSSGAGFVKFNAFNSVPQQWSFSVVDTSGMVLGYPTIYYPGAAVNQAPAAATTMPSVGEGASTSNTRAPPPAARERGSCSSWLSLRRN